MIYSYTDWHDVDEDLRTIMSYGGRWRGVEGAGVFRHTAADSSLSHSNNDTVASRLIYLS